MLTNFILTGKAFLLFTLTLETDIYSLIDDRLKKTLNTLCIKFFNNLIAYIMTMLISGN